MQNYLTFGEHLINRGLISTDDLKKVLRLQEEQHAALAHLIIDLGFVSEEEILPLLSEYMDIPCVSLKDFPPATLSTDLLFPSVDFLKLARIAPLKVEEEEVVVSVADPMDLAHLHAVEIATGLRVKPLLARGKEILERIGALFESSAMVELASGGDGSLEVGALGDEEDVEYLRDMASEVPIIRTVNQMIGRALESRASDIHIEPFENHLKVRYRIDGILHEMDPPPRQMSTAIIPRFKILAQLNIAERRLPQDGRFKIRIVGKDVDLRIATIPTLYGESVVIRLLERSQIFADLDSLGFLSEVLGHLYDMISKPHGMVLVTGPTGSGKTTTLYGALQKINDPGKKSSPSKIRWNTSSTASTRFN